MHFKFVEWAYGETLEGSFLIYLLYIKLVKLPSEAS